MPREFLLEYKREPVPTWLRDFMGASFNRNDFFGSRVVFYPGSGIDGQPVKLFASSHSAHCFVYTDYGLSLPSLRDELENHGFSGYNILYEQILEEKELAPKGVAYHVNPNEAQRVYRNSNLHSYGFFVILERDDDLDDEHGAQWIAILFLGADGFAAYDALFCQRESLPPFAVVVQDHGFGGAYERFDRNGLLERLARSYSASPQWLLVAENSKAWVGYSRVPGIAGVPGGASHHLRCLYEVDK